MAQILVRNLEDSVVEQLKVRARKNGRSLEEEVRYILEQSARFDMAKSRHKIMEIQRKLEGRIFTDSAELIREDRER